MECRNKVKNIFNYLLNVKTLNEKITRKVSEYDKVYWEKDISKIKGCELNSSEDKDWWLIVDKKAKKIYDYLFNLYLQLEKKSQEMEIVWGHGFLAWNIDGEEIQHPILTTKMDMKFIASEGKFVFTPCKKTEVESFFLQNLPIYSMDELLNIKNYVSSIDLYPRQFNNIKGIIEKVCSCLYNGEEEHTCISESVDDKIKYEKYPIFYNCPHIIIRKNDMKLWSMEIKNILEEIDNGFPIPKSIEALVTDNQLKQDEDIAKEWNEVNSNPLFPLSSNDEQDEIVKRICDNFGVVVQGPPGTGKSHTISNLICHLLSHGKKVLVTSETDKALRVLSEKIPEEIRALCISVLGNDTKSFKELDESIRKITDKLSTNPQILQSDIKKLEREISLCRNDQAKLISKLEEIKNIESRKINYFGEVYTLTEISKWIRENEENYSWIDDELKGNTPPPVSEREFERLIFLLDNVNKNQIKKINSIKVILDNIPTYEELRNKINKFVTLKNEIENNKDELNRWKYYDNTRFQKEKLLILLKNAEKDMKYIENSDFKELLKDYSSSKILRSMLSNLNSKCNSYVERLGIIRKDLNSHKVEIPEDINIDKFEKDFNKIFNVLNSKGKINKLFKYVHRECQYIIDDCKVDYKPIETTGQASIVKLFLEEKFIIRRIADLWNNTVGQYKNLSMDINNKLDIRKLEERIYTLNLIVKWNYSVKNEIIKGFGNIIIPNDIKWYLSDTYTYLIDNVYRIANIYEYNSLKAHIGTLKKLLNRSQELKCLYEALDELNLNKLEMAYKEISSLMYTRNQVNEINQLVSRLKIQCPILSETIFEKDRSKLKNWSRAWRWKQWDSMLNKVYRLDIDEIEGKIDNEKRKEKKLIEEIVSKKSWYNQILRTTEVQKRSLFSWMQAVKRIGKGTGKFTSEYMKIAQGEMEKCKGMIPVWIMPLNRVIENIKLSRDQFDVIIFDESSQSNIFSICALMRAKKAIIVGDDKQISPEAIGVNHNDIKDLIERYLKNIPHNEWFDMQTSLYDTALRVFPNRLMLKEHFRCIPEIIQFSNELSYSKEIIPLRHAEDFERFNNPIETVKVENGTREQNKALNIPEAEALVNKIKECINNKKYGGMTMGVISLLGEQQAEYIQNLLRKSIGEEEIVKRRLICGDAYSFQGDERDVMFLSMVIGKNVKFTALTRESDFRRFNVAASRAKNQMWLFHSIDIDDLSNNCVRYYLLRYCLNYNKLKGVSNTVEHIFYSQFQKDVYKNIKEKGYNIIPNVKIGKYNIDFVIKGFGSRVALMCEDSMKENNNTFKENLLIQMRLKRVGWKIFRIRGFEFYRNINSYMNKLEEKLNELNIEKLDNSSEYKIQPKKIYKPVDKLKVV